MSTNKMGHPAYKSGKYLKKGFKPPAHAQAVANSGATATSSASTTSDRLLGGERKLIQDY